MKILFLGRGPIAKRCLKHCSPTLALMNDDGVRHDDGWLLDAIQRYGIDTLIGVQYQWKLAPAVLAVVRHRAYQLHNAKLPDYRGHNCIHWALANGDKTYTTTIFQMVGDIDEGPIVGEATTEIRPHDTADVLYWRTATTADFLMSKFIGELDAGRLRPRPQGPGGRYYHKNEMPPQKEAACPGC